MNIMNSNFANSINSNNNYNLNPFIQHIFYDKNLNNSNGEFKKK